MIFVIQPFASLSLKNYIFTTTKGCNVFNKYIVNEGYRVGSSQKGGESRDLFSNQQMSLEVPKNLGLLMWSEVEGGS